MDSRENEESWIADFSQDLGIKHLDTHLLHTAGTILDDRPSDFPHLEQLLEFSFVTPQSSRANGFRYVIDLTHRDREHIERIVSTGMDLVGIQPEKVVYPRPYEMFETSFDQPGGQLFYGAGAGHARDGSLAVFKTYWRVPAPVADLGHLLPPGERAELEDLLAAVRAFWPDWRSARLVGIDYLPTHKCRLKVYLPEKSSSQPLSISTFCLFLLDLGWRVDVSELATLSYFVLAHGEFVEPTAFSVGLVIGDTPSVKLEVAVPPYFDCTEAALHAVSCLAEALRLDSAPLRAGLAAMEKHSPSGRRPAIEVICVDFCPKGVERVSLYSRLRVSEAAGQDHRPNGYT